jgi:hypothetical protein
VEKTTDLLQVTDKLYHMMLYRIHLIWAGFELTTLKGIGTDCTGSCKSNNHTITTTTAPINDKKTNNINISYFLWFYCSQNFKLICLSNISTLSIPDEGYPGNVSFVINLISLFLFNIILVILQCYIQLHLQEEDLLTSREKSNQLQKQVESKIYLYDLFSYWQTLSSELTMLKVIR